MSVLGHLEPKSVFTFFEQLCAIPHGSGNTRAVSDWLADFGRQRGLEVHQDASNNVILIKPAVPGYEQAAPVILQGHMDMVCEKASGCRRDMASEGLDLAVEGDTVYARGTTLGGDDGIAVAMALALLDTADIPHPRLEVVLTVDEEIGMLGAAALDVTPLQGRRLINIDSEEEGILTVSCAGGATVQCVLPVRRAPFPGSAVTISVTGLQGGHSGTEIDKGRANADALLARILCRAENLRLVRADGGLKDNAICPEASAMVVTDGPDALTALCAQMHAAFRHEYRVTDPGVTVRCQPCEAALPFPPMDDVSTRRCICLLACLPNGVQAMSADIPGLVQTSLNLGILTTGEEALCAALSVRSSIASQKQMLMDRLACLTRQLGGQVHVSGDYPAWEYDNHSPLRELFTAVYRAQYGREMRVEAIHAGLECGLLAGKLPGLDCVSFGPDLTEVHTCREKLHISSVQRVWRMLLEVLRQMK